MQYVILFQCTHCGTNKLLNIFDHFDQFMIHLFMGLQFSTYDIYYVRCIRVSEQMNEWSCVLVSRLSMLISHSFWWWAEISFRNWLYGVFFVSFSVAWTKDFYVKWCGQCTRRHENKITHTHTPKTPNDFSSIK